MLYMCTAFIVMHCYQHLFKRGMIRYKRSNVGNLRVALWCEIIVAEEWGATPDAALAVAGGVQEGALNIGHSACDHAFL